MNRIFLLPLLAAPLLIASPTSLIASPASSFSRVERGNLTFENVPESNAELTAKLRDYLNARQATPLGWTPKDKLLIATRFGDIDQLHLVQQAAGARRQLTFLQEPVAEADPT